MIDSTSHSASQEYVFIGKNEAAKLIGYAPSTLKKLRASGALREDIHWIRINSRSLRYNKILLLDWISNRNDLVAHERAVNAFLLSLPSNQRKAQHTSSTLAKKC